MPRQYSYCGASWSQKHIIYKEPAKGARSLPPTIIMETSALAQTSAIWQGMVNLLTCTTFKIKTTTLLPRTENKWNCDLRYQKCCVAADAATVTRNALDAVDQASSRLLISIFMPSLWCSLHLLSKCTEYHV